MALAVGSLLQDSRYQIHAVLGSTDVDVTYEAVHTYLERTIILKQLRSDVDWSVESQPPSRALMARLTRLAQSQHLCLGKVLDCFEDNEQLYLILPTYSEPTLEQWLESSAPLEPTAVWEALRPLADSLEKLHQNGLVYGQLTLQSLRYRAQTNEMIMADIGWQTLLVELLGDRHQGNHTPTADICGLAQIAHHLLGEKTLSTSPSIQAFLADTLESTPVQTLSASVWLDQLEARFTSDQMTSIETLLNQEDDLSQDRQGDQFQSSPESSSQTSSEPSSQKIASTKGVLIRKRRRWLPALLGITSILAAVSGGTVGYVFRTQDATQLDQAPLFGSEIFGSDQDFPPSEHWPGLKTKDYGTSVLFERLPTQRVANPPAPNEVGVVPWEQVNEQAPPPQFIPYRERERRAPAPNATSVPVGEDYPFDEPLGNTPNPEEENVVELDQGGGDRPSSPSSSEQGGAIPAPNPTGEAVPESPPGDQSSSGSQSSSGKPASPSSPATPYVTEMPPAIESSPISTPSTSAPSTSTPSTSTDGSLPPSVNRIPTPVPVPLPVPPPPPLITPIAPPPQSSVDTNSTMESTDISSVGSGENRT